MRQPQIHFTLRETALREDAERLAREAGSTHHLVIVGRDARLTPDLPGFFKTFAAAWTQSEKEFMRVNNAAAFDRAVSSRRNIILMFVPEGDDGRQFRQILSRSDGPAICCLVENLDSVARKTLETMRQHATICHLAFERVPRENRSMRRTPATMTAAR